MWRRELFSMAPYLYKHPENKDLQKYGAILTDIVRQIEWGGVYPIDYSGGKGNVIFNFETGEFRTLD